MTRRLGTPAGRNVFLRGDAMGKEGSTAVATPASGNANVAIVPGVPAVYGAIGRVIFDLAHTGISKDRKNQTQGYSFRGIDDVYNALAPMLAKHGLVVLPRILTRECIERQTQKGGTLFYVVVEAEFDFVAVVDGSTHVVRTFGEAMDSADKATNKAMSAAFKYAAFQAFCIPTEGDNDADATTPEPSTRKAVGPAPEPEGFAEWFGGLTLIAAKGTEALQAAWKETTPEFRQHATFRRSAVWAELKAIAAAATEALKRAAEAVS
jgi:hypothetical protein